MIKVYGVKKCRQYYFLLKSFSCMHGIPFAMVHKDKHLFFVKKTKMTTKKAILFAHRKLPGNPFLHKGRWWSTQHTLRCLRGPQRYHRRSFIVLHFPDIDQHPLSGGVIGRGSSTRIRTTDKNFKLCKKYRLSRKLWLRCSRQNGLIYKEKYFQYWAKSKNFFN